MLHDKPSIQLRKAANWKLRIVMAIASDTGHSDLCQIQPMEHNSYSVFARSQISSSFKYSLRIFLKLSKEHEQWN
ncbi:hypothetical protein [Nostoc sp. CCY 9925]|uniref:hypothetical protein n=1 Tax=Nostoc sp. CCY 9925 TaxID=3103865 RepID=UPI0039C602E6